MQSRPDPKTIPLFDSHAHLSFSDFGDRLPAVLERAREAGVAGIVSIGSGEELRSARESVDLAARHASIWASVGLHPHQASSFSADTLTILEGLASSNKVVAVGEIGLDYHYDFSPRPDQERAFAAQLDLTRKLGLPVIVHSREAEEDTIRILRDGGAQTIGGVIHCFSSGPALAHAALDLGFYLSFSGMITFPKLEFLRDIAVTVPLDRMLIETDAPYLAPVPLRGRFPNEPSYIVHTARCLADLRGLSLEEFSRITQDNACRLFRIEISSVES